MSEASPPAGRTYHRCVRRSSPLLLVLLALTACTSVVTGDPSPGVRLEKRGPAGAVPQGLERFYGQEIGWGGCSAYADSTTTRALYRDRPSLECARVEVPLDYAAPEGGTIRIGVLRRPATGDRIGSLLLNPGGPGASGMEAAVSLVPQVLTSEIGARFDLVGFDPRGVGASEPRVRCLSDAERDEERLDVDVDASPEGVAETERENQEYARKCAENTSAEFLANLGTRDVVKDLDVLRSALGDEKLSYVGYSYGTHIGAVYAEAFPANVRAMVLDGAVDPAQDEGDSLVAQGAGFQQAFEEFAAWCAKRPDCALGTDPAKAAEAFQGLTRPLVEQPVAVQGRKLSYNDSITGVVQALYSSQLWEPLNTGLTELKAGQGQTLLLLADTYYGRDADGKYSAITDAFTAIQCVDSPRDTDRAKLAEVARRYREAAPFLDDGAPPVGVLDACAFWPVPVTAAPTLTARPVGLPPVLVISTTGDPATPYDAGVSLARVLGGALLTYEGEQHTVYLQGVECVDAIGTAYLVGLATPQAGARC